MPSTMKPCTALLLLTGMLASPAAIACTVSSALLAFGAINPLDKLERDSSADITVTCPSLTMYTVSLSAGSGTYNQRTLRSGSNILNYNLYIDPQRTLIWGDGSGVTRTVQSSADTMGTTHTVYGTVPAQPRAVPGVYSDSIVVTVSY